MSISTNCTGLKSLNLNWCKQISDTSIISVSTHCTGLQSLSLLQMLVSSPSLRVAQDSRNWMFHGPPLLKPLLYPELRTALDYSYLILMNAMNSVMMSYVMNSVLYLSYELPSCPSIPPFRSD